MNDESNFVASNSASPSTELLGAVDIVEAFTALRHELKLQVRGGRELQQLISEGLQRIDQRLVSHTSANSDRKEATALDTSHESRKLAESLAETEDSLRRALNSLMHSTSAMENYPESTIANSISEFDEAVRKSSWLVRKLAQPLVSIARKLVEQASLASERQVALLDPTRKGLELLHDRLIRLMQQCDIERFDVIGKPFDAEMMHAIDRIPTSSMPTGYVAEQIRPAYLWKNRILCFADVRLSA